MKQGFHICLYKRKGQPVIPVYVQGDEAEICMSLDDFMAELLREIGPVTWIFTEKTFRDKAEKAIDSVVLNIKKGAAGRIIK